jgi:hypothetical protein
MAGFFCPVDGGVGSVGDAAVEACYSDVVGAGGGFESDAGLVVDDPAGWEGDAVDVGAAGLANDEAAGELNAVVAAHVCSC